MALGALSLVNSSGVVLDSGSAMQPVGANTGSQLQTMSASDTMKEVFFDIRDGISNLGSIFSDKISGLNKHLAFRLETLNNTMSNIGNIASKDLELEETQTDIAIENEKDEDQEKSLSGGGILTDDFKGGITSVLNKLKPEGFIQSLIALGVGLALLIDKL